MLFWTWHSTDFEVHRNWKAITYSTDLSEWYFEKTSAWTLDYPPFFAYFEWCLGQVAAIYDPRITRLDNLLYKGGTCILFMRTSVLLSDLVFTYSCWRFMNTLNSGNNLKSWILINLVNAGLLMIDNHWF